MDELLRKLEREAAAGDLGAKERAWNNKLRADPTEATATQILKESEGQAFPYVRDNFPNLLENRLTAWLTRLGELANNQRKHAEVAALHYLRGDMKSYQTHIEKSGTKKGSERKRAFAQIAIYEALQGRFCVAEKFAQQLPRSFKQIVLRELSIESLRYDVATAMSFARQTQTKERPLCISYLIETLAPAQGLTETENILKENQLLDKALLAMYAARSGEVDFAVDLAKKLPKGKKPEIYAILAQEYINQGELDRALEAVSLAGIKGDKVTSKLARQALLADRVDIVEKLTDLLHQHKKNSDYDEFVLEAARQGMKKIVNKFSNRGTQLRYQAEIVAGDTAKINQLRTTYSGYDKPKLALAAAETLDVGVIKSWLTNSRWISYRAVVNKMAAHGRYEDAKALAQGQLTKSEISDYLCVGAALHNDLEAFRTYLSAPSMYWAKFYIAKRVAKAFPLADSRELGDHFNRPESLEPLIWTGRFEEAEQVIANEAENLKQMSPEEVAWHQMYNPNEFTQYKQLLMIISPTIVINYEEGERI